MKSIGRFLVSVFWRATNIITGGIIALYYTYSLYVPTNPQTQKIIDIILPIIALLIAFYLAWKERDEAVQKLEKSIKEAADSAPKYLFETVDERPALNAIIEKVTESIAKANEKREHAPSSTGHWGMQLLSMYGPPTKDSWTKYIKELEDYRKYIKDIIDLENMMVFNIILTNKGSADTNIHISFEFFGIKQIVDFHGDEVEMRLPREPSSDHLSFIPHLSSANKLGVNREVHTDLESFIEIEVERLRNEDYVYALDDPIYAVPTTGKQEIHYELRSTLCTSKKGAFPIKLKRA